LPLPYAPETAAQRERTRWPDTLAPPCGNVPNDLGITGLTDAQLKSGLPAGFDPKIWAVNSKINNGYPYLLANPPPK
jgi:hypothetical protein